MAPTVTVDYYDANRNTNPGVRSEIHFILSLDKLWNDGHVEAPSSDFDVAGNDNYRYSGAAWRIRAC